MFFDVHKNIQRFLNTSLTCDDNNIISNDFIIIIIIIINEKI